MKPQAERDFGQLHVYMRYDLVDAVRAAAKSDGRPVSSWVRQIVVARLKELGLERAQK